MFKTGISILLLTAFSMAGTSVSGQIITPNRSPLAYAVISGKADGNWVIADENGQFNYHFTTGVGDTLSVTCYGYHSDNFVISDKSFYSLILQPQPIKFDDVIIAGENSNFYGQIINTYQQDIGKNNPQIIFQQIPGITIRSYGGKAGITTLSTHGSPAVNTKILLDGIDLTSAQNGETDLSQIPESLINQITVASSPGIFYGSGAVDGVLRISPQIQQTYFSTSLGNFGFATFSSNINKNWSKWSANLSAGYLKDKGNYRYSTDNIDTTRTNNDFQRIYVALRTVGRISPNSNISAYILESHQKRGVAGSIDWPSPNAKREDNLRLANLTLNQLHKNGYSKIQLSYRNSYENYNDPNPWWPIASIHDIYSTTLRFQHHNILWNSVSGSFLYEGKLENLISTDVGTHNRYYNSLATLFTIPLWKDFNITPAARLDISGKSAVNPTMDFRLVYNVTAKSEFEYHLGSGFRYPTLNDLYWQPGGNPELHPEKSKYNTLKYKLYLNEDDLSNVYLNIGGRITNDLIQWAPIDETNFIWQPQNIASSKRTNLTIGGQLKFRSLPIQISAHYTLQKTKDIDLNKPLLYAPENIGYIRISYDYRSLTLGFQTHYTGERLANYNFPLDTNLPDYWLASASLEYKIELLSNSLILNVDLNNLLNLQYMSINGYPEPGRMFNFGIKYQLTN